MAWRNGYFKDEGLAVKTLPGGPMRRRRRSRWPRAGEFGYGVWLPFSTLSGAAMIFVLVAAPSRCRRRHPVAAGQADPHGGRHRRQEDLAQGPNERTAIARPGRLNNLPKQWEFVRPVSRPTAAWQGRRRLHRLRHNQAVTLEVKMNMVRGKTSSYFVDSMGYNLYDLVREARTTCRPTGRLWSGFLRRLTPLDGRPQDPSVAARLCSPSTAPIRLDLKQQTRQTKCSTPCSRPDPRPTAGCCHSTATHRGTDVRRAKASGRDNLAGSRQLCDFTVMQEVHASLKKSDRESTPESRPAADGATSSPSTARTTSPRRRRRHQGNRSPGSEGLGGQAHVTAKSTIDARGQIAMPA